MTENTEHFLQVFSRRSESVRSFYSFLNLFVDYTKGEREKRQTPFSLNTPTPIFHFVKFHNKPPDILYFSSFIPNKHRLLDEPLIGKGKHLETERTKRKKIFFFQRTLTLTVCV